MYACSCSRSELEGTEARYPGTCREGPRRRDVPLAMRLRVDGFPAVTVDDRLQGRLTETVAETVGDFVLKRRDGYFAYQLAVVVDDAFQGITDVVRGADLLDNTPRQRVLQAALGVASPRTMHLPVLLEADGGKLSKSRRSLPADPASAPAVLTEILTLLRHTPPLDLQHAPVAVQLAWAKGVWDPLLLQGVRDIIQSA